MGCTPSTPRTKIPWHEYKTCHMEKHITQDQKDFIQRLGMKIHCDVYSQRNFFHAMDTLSDEEIKKMLKDLRIPLYDLSCQLHNDDLTEQEIEWKAYINEEWLDFENFLP